MRRLVGETPPVKFPGAPPGGHVVVVLGPGPENVGEDHVDAPEAPRLQGLAKKLNGGVKAVLLHHKVLHPRTVAGLYGSVHRCKLGACGLFRENMLAVPGSQTDLIRMDSRGGAEDHHVTGAFFEHLLHGAVGGASPAFSRLLCPFGENVAAPSQGGLSLFLELLNGFKVVFADPSATYYADGVHVYSSKFVWFVCFCPSAGLLWCRSTSAKR